MTGHTEIERKWIVSSFEGLPIIRSGWQNIRQAYMGPTTRVRINGAARSPKRPASAVISVKLWKSELSREEFNYPIPMEDAEVIFDRHANMEKDRAKLEGGFTLDVFRGRLEGLLLIEKEYESEEEANADEIPAEWEERDVTGNPDYINASLVRYTFDPKLGLFIDDPVGVQFGGEPFSSHIVDDSMIEYIFVTGDEEDLGIDKPLIIK